jgi:hypothetical protein
MKCRCYDATFEPYAISRRSLPPDGCNHGRSLRHAIAVPSPPVPASDLPSRACAGMIQRQARALFCCSCVPCRHLQVLLSATNRLLSLRPAHVVSTPKSVRAATRLVLGKIAQEPQSFPIYQVPRPIHSESVIALADNHVFESGVRDSEQTRSRSQCL